MSTPSHLRLPFLGLVFVGGALGTAAREALVLFLPTSHDFPWVILSINVVGAFLLGLLLEALAMRGPDRGIRRTVRLLVGTGFMGGFTTYSTLATAVASLVGAGSAGIGIAYGLATVVLGGMATWAGFAVAIGTAPPDSATHPGDAR